MDLPRRLAAEFGGSLVLSVVVIGSGIMGESLAGGNVAIALLANTAATAAILYVLITALGPISGAHFNPAVSFVMACRREIATSDAVFYAMAQVSGCIGGALFAHALFELPLIQQSLHARAGVAQLISEGAATFALVACILLVSRARPQATAAAVALTIAAGYWGRRPPRSPIPPSPLHARSATRSPAFAPSTRRGLSWRNLPVRWPP